MAEPITIGVAVITGLVSVYKAYVEYKAAVAKAKAEQQAAPAKTAEAAKGEQAAPLVQAAVQQHGDAKDQRTLVNFADDPETYQEALQKVLTRLVEHNSAFASQLQTAAQQANIQTGGIQGSVNVSGQGKIYGPATGVSTGTITYTYNPTDADKDA